MVRHGSFGGYGRARDVSAFLALILLSLSLSFLFGMRAASAATQIDGAADGLRVNARDATIVEILDALKSRFKLTYQAHSYDRQPLTGIYSGTLRAALGQILEGNNYVLKSSEDGLEIVIFGAAGQVSQAAAGSAPGAVPDPNPSLSGSAPPPLSSFVSQNRQPGAATPTGTP
jgi:hypothetical protein